jgi:hypothetical protein
MSRLRYTARTFAVFAVFWFAAAPAWAASPQPPVYVILWFDTEDYILPASDDAALHVAEFLTRQKVPATFKVVGEKARTLERRGRTDVIEALKKHENGYHSNFHSVQPTPAVYLNELGWDEGVAEFDRRERPGTEDLKRIFGQSPSCYGQPGSSWAPQTLGTMRKWGMPVYLDSGRHIDLNGKPFFFCGVLNLYRLTYTVRSKLDNPKDLEEVEDKFVEARKKIQAEGGGIVSIYYHPCEFVHKEFWDGVNFKNGANPPRDQWKVPAQKSPEETKVAYDIFEGYIRFIQRFDDVKFITAREAARIYADKARTKSWKPADIKQIAEAVGDEPTFQKQSGYALTAGEVFAILSRFVAERANGRDAPTVEYPGSPYGPATPVAAFTEPLTVEGEQFLRTAIDVTGYVQKHQRIPPAVWLGSNGVPPEAFLRALALVAADLADGKAMPKTVEIKPTKLGASKYMAEDEPKLWGWAIHPPGFHAPALMEMAKRQAWTLKPATFEVE